MQDVFSFHVLLISLEKLVACKERFWFEACVSQQIWKVGNGCCFLFLIGSVFHDPGFIIIIHNSSRKRHSLFLPFILLLYLEHHNLRCHFCHDAVTDSFLMPVAEGGKKKMSLCLSTSESCGGISVRWYGRYRTGFIDKLDAPQNMYTWRIYSGKGA